MFIERRNKNNNFFLWKKIEEIRILWKKYEENLNVKTLRLKVLLKITRLKKFISRLLWFSVVGSEHAFCLKGRKFDSQPVKMTDFQLFFGFSFKTIKKLPAIGKQLFK